MLGKFIGFGLICMVITFSAEAYNGPGDPDRALPEPGCVDQGPEYYSIDLVTTRKVPGTGQGRGKAVMTFVASPFGISITKDGSYRHQLDVKLERVNHPESGEYVAWVTTPDLDKIKLLGVLDSNLETSGTVEWNKYLVVISLEKGEPGNRWAGPIAFRGLSKSGFMHTMAGHGPYSQDPCAKYGYY